MNDIYLTNNPIVREHAPAACGKMLSNAPHVVFVEAGYVGVLKTARDMIHQGHKLLSHPLSGSIKPGETPYKTIAISGSAASACDFDSLRIIEESIQTAEKLCGNERDIPEEVRKDLQLIDYTLIFGGLNV